MNKEYIEFNQKYNKYGFNISLLLLDLLNPLKNLYGLEIEGEQDSFIFFKSEFDSDIDTFLKSFNVNISSIRFCNNEVFYHSYYLNSLHCKYKERIRKEQYDKLKAVIGDSYKIKKNKGI